jgi:hypothetical protein
VSAAAVKAAASKANAEARVGLLRAEAPAAGKAHIGPVEGDETSDSDEEGEGVVRYLKK